MIGGKVRMMKKHSNVGTTKACRTFLAMALGFVVMTIVAKAGEENHEPIGHDEADEHEYARDRLRAGKALPLAKIVAHVLQAVPGKLLNARLRQGHDMLIYELTILSDKGDYYIVTVNALDNTILKTEEE